jgi:hypothetical protein
MKAPEVLKLVETLVNVASGDSTETTAPTDNLHADLYGVQGGTVDPATQRGGIECMRRPGQFSPAQFAK